MQYLFYNQSFKPYYNWTAFNTKSIQTNATNRIIVLNLVISGLFNTDIGRRNKFTKLLIYKFY